MTHTALSMKPTLLALRPAMSLLALALLCGGASRTRANSEGTLTFASTTKSAGPTVVEINGTIFTFPAAMPLTFASSGAITAFGLIPVSISGQILSIGTVNTTSGLYGSVNGLNLKKTKSGSSTRVKATVGLQNTSGTALHNVTATVYLSADNTLSADDTKITTLNLSDYVTKGKIGKHKTLDLPLNEKVPSLLASYLDGKYLIVVLSADDLGTLPTTPIVVGPITLP